MQPVSQFAQPGTPLRPKSTLILDAIALWAKSLPESNWVPGAPPATGDAYFAVKTTTGRILTGTARSFRQPMRSLIEGQVKYGPIVAHVVASRN